MSGKHPENHDYPMSEIWRDYHTETRLLPKLKKREPTIKVSGMTLHNIDPDAPIDETVYPKLLENLKKLGILPKTPQKSEPKDSQPKKITPPLLFIHDPERIMKITSDPHTLGSLHISEREHQVRVWKQRRRAEQGLPQKKLSFKEMGRLLTKEEVAILTENGYDLQRMRRDTPSYEKMLLDLKQYQAQHKEKVKA